jgi:hypothetical protein
MGGAYNLVNLALYHYAGNNPVRYTDPTGLAPRALSSDDSGAPLSLDQRMEMAILKNKDFKSEGMACDVYVTQVLTDAGAKPSNWPDPNITTVGSFGICVKTLGRMSA